MVFDDFSTNFKLSKKRQNMKVGATKYISSRFESFYAKISLKLNVKKFDQKVKGLTHGF